MPNFTLWLGVICAGSILFWSATQVANDRNILDPHSFVIVVGGAFAAMLISTPAAKIFSALRALLWILLPANQPPPEEIALEISRLSKRAHSEGGLLALRGEGQNFAQGFLKRAIDAAAACGETDATREILELEIRRRRIARTEEANVYRLIGTLAPMFGLLGTLIGMLKVLTSMSDPLKLGPAMALALSSAFIGISIANFICIPIAGQIRLMSMRETEIQEMIIEGVIAIASNQPTYQVELKMSAYLQSGAITTSGTNREPA